MSLNEVSIKIPGDFIPNVFGQFDAFAKKIERSLHVTLVLRDDSLKIIGAQGNIDGAKEVFEQLIALAERGNVITEQNVNYALALLEEHRGSEIVEIDKDIICHTINGKPVKPKTIGQKEYVDAIRKKMIVFGMGPAGTGKTYLAMAMAITAFKNEQVGRIILTRPAIEAGEKLGFLPGDLQQKVDPYLRPLYDGLFDMLGAETYERLVEKQIIEVAPLAYMRGRTLDDSFIILDEAQNTTREQMKMFLTRLGFGSKIVITGDITQIDLPGDKVSGLKEAIRVLDGVEDIQICRLTPADVVRHVLVQRIVAAYDKYEKNRLPDERARTFTKKPDWKREKK